MKTFVSLPLIIIVVFLTSSLLASPFKQQQINPAFEQILHANPDFMNDGGAQLLTDETGQQALVAIGKVFVEPGKQLVSREALIRKGELQAKARMIELVGKVEITSSRSSSSRDKDKGTAISTFLQATGSKAVEKIGQLPVIGSWQDEEQTLYVAVGKMNSVPTFQHLADITPTAKAAEDIPDIQGEEPYVSILRAMPDLLENGGVRGVIMADGRRVLLSVASAPSRLGPAKAHKIARLKALRNLAAQQKGITVTSLQYLADGERLTMGQNNEQVMLSEFMEMQQEEVRGFVQVLDVVAETEINSNQIIIIGN